MARTFFRFPVPDHEYVQRIRRHPPSSLLPLIASVSAQRPTKEEWRQDGSGLYRPWGLADAAWLSLSRGNEHRQRPATDSDLTEILGQYVALDDVYRHLPVGERLEGFLLRIAGQQFTWQEDDFSELARSLALLVHTTPTKVLEVLTDGWEHDLLGCPLADYVGLAQLLYTAATNRQGRFDLTWVPEPELTVFEELTTHSALKTVLDRHFATDAAQERARVNAADPLLRRYTPNPLRSRPLVRGFGCDYLIPVTPAVLGKVSPMGLYYTGNEHYKERFEAFTRDLGELFEQYVGRHLRLLPGADVHSEIVYDRDNKKSVDWIVVLPRLVLLVEVKSARPTAGLRLGPQEFGEELTRKLGKAFRQINRSAKLIEDRHQAFAHIPVDRPAFGIVVTMEPYHLINAPDFRTLLPSTTVPTAVASASELEDAVVAVDPCLESVVVSRMGHPPAGGWSLRDLIGGGAIINPILDQAWEAYPWGTEDSSHTGRPAAAHAQTDGPP